MYSCLILLIILISSAGVEAARIDALSDYSAATGRAVEIYGRNFGQSPGYIVLSGLRVEPTFWSDTEIRFSVPQQAGSGFLYVRDFNAARSNSVGFKVDRDLPSGQMEPENLAITDTGLLGASFLVETDGAYIYGVLGFETLSTYRILRDETHKLCSRMYLPQRVGDIRLHDGYLFCAGDHGLFVYRCSDLQAGDALPIAAIAGASYMAVDIRQSSGKPVAGTLVAACEYLPQAGQDTLSVPLYRFASEELTLIDSFQRTVLPSERQHAVAIDPCSPKVYVSGYETLLGNDKYLLQIDFSGRPSPFVSHRDQTAGRLLFDMDVHKNVLWAGISGTGTEFFRVYELKPDTEPPSLIQTVLGKYGLGRTTRVRIVDDEVTVGSAWSGARPDVFLLKTFESGTSPVASVDSLDWAFDVTGYSLGTGEGRIIVADEWGGFPTYAYRTSPQYKIGHEEDYRWVVGGAMTEGLHLAADRIYIAGRGMGPWSADRFDLADESEWRRVTWQWSESEPQPHPVSALCTRKDPALGTLIVALAHEKAMAWGQKMYGILYQETANSILPLAVSEEIDPEELYSSGFSVIWPATDLVYMTTGTDGIRGYVVDPQAPSISLHRDCRDEGFGADVFSSANMAICMAHYIDGRYNKIIVGSQPSLLVADPTLLVFNAAYPEGVPDRSHPDRPITITHESSLSCSRYRTIDHLEMRPNGLIAAATSQGLILLHASWIPLLNQMPDSQAWNLIRVPEQDFEPWWHDQWTNSFADVSFADDDTIYAVKVPNGVWMLDVTMDWDNLTHECIARGYYPGVQCGIDYTHLLSGWANPDIVTLHHPYDVAADGDSVYVTGWSGKVQRLHFSEGGEVPVTLPGDLNRDSRVDYIDLERLFAEWLWAGPPAMAQQDIVPDGRINFVDYAALVANWLDTTDQ